MNAAVDAARARSATATVAPTPARVATPAPRERKPAVPPTPASAPPAAAPRTAAAAAARGPRASLARLSLWLATLVLLAGWVAPLGDYVTPRSGLGYALGIVGGSLMLVLLIYPARKRLSGLAAIGSARAWFQFHVVLGVVGPLCILYHCNYHLGATNSNVALLSMLVVAGSGLVGRYLYGRIYDGLDGQKATLADLRAEADRLRAEAGGAGRLVPELGPRLDAAERRIARHLPVVPKALSAAIACRLERRSLHRYVHKTLRDAAAASSSIGRHRRSFTRAADRYADSRLTAARRVAEFESCEKLFSFWHLLHLALFGLLLIAGIVHVIAVNVY